MGKVLTANTITDFPTEMNESITATEIILMNGTENRATTKIRALEGVLCDLPRYEIEHFKRLKIRGTVQGVDFNHILKEYKFIGYKDETIFFIVSEDKHETQHSSLTRLKKTTEVKCSPFVLDLKRGVQNIITRAPNVEIVGGNINDLNQPNLRRADLSGGEVNRSADWRRYIRLPNSIVSNIKIVVDHPDFPDGIKLLINNKGVFYCSQRITEQQLISTSKEIIQILTR